MHIFNHSVILLNDSVSDINSGPIPQSIDASAKLICPVDTKTSDDIKLEHIPATVSSCVVNLFKKSIDISRCTDFELPGKTRIVARILRQYIREMANNNEAPYTVITMLAK